jgi:hypothetical protein
MVADALHCQGYSRRQTGTRPGCGLPSALLSFFKSCAKKWDVWRYWVVGSEDMLKDIIPTARCKLFTRLASPAASQIHKVLYKYK